MSGNPNESYAADRSATITDSCCRRPLSRKWEREVLAASAALTGTYSIVFWFCASADVAAGHKQRWRLVNRAVCNVVYNIRRFDNKHVSSHRRIHALRERLRVSGHFLRVSRDLVRGLRVR
jgi:hypothetical protein